MGTVVLSLFIVWIGATVSAPVRQRNELRQMYEHTAAAIFGAGYERYISSILRNLEQYTSQPLSGDSRFNYEVGRVIITGDDGRLTEIAIKPPGLISIWWSYAKSQ